MYFCSSTSCLEEVQIPSYALFTSRRIRRPTTTSKLEAKLRWFFQFILHANRGSRDKYNQTHDCFFTRVRVWGIASREGISVIVISVLLYRGVFSMWTSAVGRHLCTGLMSRNKTTWQQQTAWCHGTQRNQTAEAAVCTLCASAAPIFVTKHHSSAAVCNLINRGNLISRLH